ncbi:MAG: TRAP transporter fused permease subunit [Desulfarculaceae bacterium]
MGIWLVIISLFQLYTANFGILQPRVQRGVHLLFLLPAAFIIFPASKKISLDKVPFYDWLLAILALLPPLYVIIFNNTLNTRLVFVDPVSDLELYLGLLNIILLIEAVRRAVVPAMAILITVFFVYLFVAPYLPGVFFAEFHSVAELVEAQFLIDTAGIYGSITGVSATFIALFVIFGAFMEKTQTGQFFTDLAARMAGRSRGGPAKIAVISSGLFGSISGVAVANVYSTGSFTIPMMKRLGYRPRFAGAVEASASTGGMLMPPVMGAGSFVMSELTGIPYVNIIIAAALGAVFYYLSLILRVHFVALRLNLKGLEKEEMLSFWVILRDSYLLIPMIALVIMLLIGYSPFLAANLAIGITFLISFFKKGTRMTPARLFDTLHISGQNMVMIALACAGADMVVSIVTNTGLALGIATVITKWAGGYLLPALFLIMVTSLILGMGLPCTPAYVIAITVGGPALLSMGCDILPAHLFVFYFAILAGVTPPVCIPAFCAASIAGSGYLQTGFEAFRLAFVGFMVPYIFIYNQAFLLKGPILEIVALSLLMLLSVIFLAAAMSGFLFHRIHLLSKIGLLFLTGLFAWLAATGELKIQFISVALAGAGLTVWWLASRRQASPSPSVGVEDFN